jgi:predicted transcriptional regulator
MPNNEATRWRRHSLKGKAASDNLSPSFTLSSSFYFRECPSKLLLGTGVLSAGFSALTLPALNSKTSGKWKSALNLDLQAKLAELASQQGRDTEELMVEAVKRMVNYDQWFMREVEKGKSSADRGELVDHDDIQKLIDRQYPG